jgi:uridine kinase
MAKSTPSQFAETPLRPMVQIILPDGRAIEGPRGASVGDFLANEKTEAPIVGAIINDELRELPYPIKIESVVRPVTMAESDGMRIYRRSLTFLLATAIQARFPDAKLTVDHSISSGGYYCEVAGREPLSQQELQVIEDEMYALVEADKPFIKSTMPTEEAVEYFHSIGFDDKSRLLAHRTKPNLVIYQLNGHRDYHHGYMVPSTRYLKWFGLEKMGDGFTLRFPRRHRPTELLPMPDYPTLLSTFRIYGDWLETLGITSVGTLNDAIVNGRGEEIILVSEALHEGRIAEIAAMVAERRDTIKVILIAGPSSSGKTVFSKRLSIQLMARSLFPFAIEMDNFFVDRDKSPRDENGEFDFESIHALDLERLNNNLTGLIEGEKVQLPHYDFRNGIQEEGPLVQLRPDQIILLEGIHGLNPKLLSNIPAESTFRIYASALTQLNLDRLNRVSTTDTRLLRRIVRDSSRRGYSAEETIRRWESVRRGEKRYIFPYQENADVMFNSALVYEGAALAPLARPLLQQVRFKTPEHVEAKRLLAFVDWFLPIQTEVIPDNSILREFIGGLILDDFVPWQSTE